MNRLTLGLLAGATATLVGAAPASAGLLDGLLKPGGTGPSPGQGGYSPPAHGSNPHAQGTVGTVDIAPTPERPAPADPATGPIGQPAPEVVVSQSRAEQNEDGSYSAESRGAGALGVDVVGSQADEGESRHGPLEALQEGLLDVLCGDTRDGICVEVLRADSEASEDGASSSTAVAEASVGGEENGLHATAGESNAEISEDENGCQDSRADSTVAQADLGGFRLADAASSSADTNQCGDGSGGGGEGPRPEGDSEVVGVAGAELACERSGDLDLLSPLASASCNAEDNSADGGQQAGTYVVREALDLFVLEGGGTSLLQVMLGGSEASRQP